MKKTISLSLVTALVLSTSTVNAGMGDWIAEKYSDAKEAISDVTDSVSNKMNKEELEPATFDLLYPTPFYKTGVFKWTAVVAVSVVVGIATVYTGGAASVPGATLIGSLLGSTWTAGLATLGGGTLASGGFGMAGGALVIATTTDVMIAGLGSFAIPKNNINGRDYSTLKIPLPKYEKGSTTVIKTFEEIENLKDELQDGKISLSEYEREIYNKYIYALENVSTYSEPYDSINGAILAYNLGKFEKSQKYLDEAYRKFPNHSSFIYYQQALLDLVDNKTVSAMNNLDRAISQEPDTLTPYLLKAQLAMDNNQMRIAIETVEDGLKNYDDDNFQLNYLGGRIAYQEGNYKKAIEYFEEALSNTRVNEIEAECKILIAKSYRKSYDSSNADKWYKDALSEIDDDTPEGRQYINHLIEIYKS